MYITYIQIYYLYLFDVLILIYSLIQLLYIYCNSLSGEEGPEDGYRFLTTRGWPRPWWCGANTLRLWAGHIERYQNLNHAILGGTQLCTTDHTPQRRSTVVEIHTFSRSSVNPLFGVGGWCEHLNAMCVCVCFCVVVFPMLKETHQP